MARGVTRKALAAPYLLVAPRLVALSYLIASCLLALPCLVLMVPASAPAHVPGLEDADDGGAVPIGGPQVSRATYGYLAADENFDEYEFTVPESVTREIGVIVPAYREHAGFRPVLVVTGDGIGAIRIGNDSDRAMSGEFEPFSLTHFWHVAQREVTFEPGIRYTIRVTPGQGDPSGRYVVVFAGPERFEGSDVASTIRQLPAIWFGAYGGAPFHWNWYALAPIVPGIGILAWLAFGARALLVRRRTR